MWNIPNILTLLRIVLIPVFVLLFYLPVEWARYSCAIVFAVAAVTDWFDGYLARRWGQVSPFGAFLDPVADKLMVAVALLLLVQSEPTPAFAIPAAVIIGREITVSALREWMAEVGARGMVAVSMIGKFKTAVQMVAILLLIYSEPLWGIPIYTVGFVLLYMAAILTLWSMVVYLRAAWPSLLGERQLRGSLEQK
ncbi:MAG: CDP-diacylglycerol--glycerol-3-phosphate 3-phosphatidyltransferase [Candidatus Thiodiazotropha sp. (ex Lucinoma annulata)]|nr:CDP-diacylglycerol--glycerol-3-phosphate 3-phosphatidyltransferase [Candidatus Thiodiazotropha sp. (ex Lucinoma borealis)]MCU7839733.1 CDP-diacylglycerol--glycerol-3-phosphate 3-phosphatidyltransferase [Candidatus Thiodiazotropha sp. (ex Troendleina suluensis)]MCU7884305.1 CDP-diacylglycerol--glycerol-3-phosphate 3-phosphatidyltransferase [Candidatus Thiodiazotropha sp. (ex Lucinoma annulata)]MCU7945591.1 CDP-diacylglycerol--glycerol-3-phosphate 3-phosphatidyltransferase [Candidatus Thiodiazo